MPFGVEEQRKEPRVNIRFAALLRWRNEHDTEITEEAYTTSVSNSGASLVTTQRLPVGKMIHVTLDIEGQRGSSTAEVKWAAIRLDGYMIGVCFKGATV